MHPAAQVVKVKNYSHSTTVARDQTSQLSIELWLLIKMHVHNLWRPGGCNLVDWTFPFLTAMRLKVEHAQNPSHMHQIVYSL